MGMFLLGLALGIPAAILLCLAALGVKEVKDLYVKEFDNRNVKNSDSKKK